MRTTDSVVGFSGASTRHDVAVDIIVPEPYREPGSVDNPRYVHWTAQVTSRGAADCSWSRSVTSYGSRTESFSSYGVMANPGRCDVTVHVRASRGAYDGVPAVSEEVTVTGASFAWWLPTSLDTPVLGQSSVTSGKKANVYGLLRTDGLLSARANQLVHLQYRPAGATKWTKVGQAVTDDRGAWEAGHKPAKSGYYRAVYPSFNYLQSSESLPVAVYVTPAPKPVKFAKLSTKKVVKSTKATTVSGKVTAAKNAGRYTALKAKVSVQFRAKGSSKWVTLKTVGSNASGKWKAKVKLSRSGHLRAIHKKTSSHKYAVSPVAKVTVKK